MKKHLIPAVLALCALVPAANAFKVDTHVWVGQQVINDLESTPDDPNGTLSFKLGDKEVKIAVPNDVREAILTNKSDYLMGNIGPDAVPDVVVGQNVIHPGLNDEEGNRIGFQTNEWLEYLLRKSQDSPTGKAFSYGFLGHAAADVFAHTYVNQYAGDVFELFDETLVEQRHFILEAFIGKHTPALKNSSGIPIGAPWEQMNFDKEYAEFIRDTLIYEKEVREEYDKSNAAKHMAAFSAYRARIDTLAEDPVWHHIDTEIAKLIAERWGIELTSGQASDLINAADNALDKVNQGIDAVQSETRIIYNQLSEADEKVFTKLKSAIDDLHSKETQWIADSRAWAEENSKALKICAEIPQIRHDWKCKKKFGVTYACGWVPSIKMAKPPGCEEAKDLLLDSLELLAHEVSSSTYSLNESLFKVQHEATVISDEVFKAQENIQDFIQKFGQNVSPLQTILGAWRDDIDNAMTEYVKMSSGLIVDTMHKDFSIDPAKAWFDCYYMSMIGIPASISSCDGLIGNIGKLKDSFKEIIRIADAAAATGGLNPFNKAYFDEKIDHEVDYLKEKIGERLEDLLPEHISDFLDVVGDHDYSAARLNLIYARPESYSPDGEKGLIMIPDMAERVMAEMQMTADNKFNPNKFPVAYNAVVLAKLALLDHLGFKDLAEAAGSTSYLEKYEGQNIVATAFRNIDGNHQWMPVPPPLPNNLSLPYAEVDHSYSSDEGFVPWKDDMRDKIFRKIFIGPLSSGIDAPSVIGKKRLVNTDYPYQVCASNPYPDDIEDRKCVVSWLIPVMSLMNN